MAVEGSLPSVNRTFHQSFNRPSVGFQPQINRLPHLLTESNQLQTHLNRNLPQLEKVDMVVEKIRNEICEIQKKKEAFFSDCE